MCVMEPASVRGVQDALRSQYPAKPTAFEHDTLQDPSRTDSGPRRCRRRCRPRACCPVKPSSRGPGQRVTASGSAAIRAVSQPALYGHSLPSGIVEPAASTTCLETRSSLAALCVRNPSAHAHSHRNVSKSVCEIGVAESARLTGFARSARPRLVGHGPGELAQPDGPSTRKGGQSSARGNAGATPGPKSAVDSQRRPTLKTASDLHVRRYPIFANCFSEARSRR